MSNNEIVILSEELWDEYSEFIDDNISSLERVAGSVILTERAYKKLIAELIEKINSENHKEQTV